MKRPPLKYFENLRNSCPLGILSLSLSLSLYVIVGCQNFDVFCETVAKHFFTSVGITLKQTDIFISEAFVVNGRLDYDSNLKNKSCLFFGSKDGRLKHK